MNVLSLFDGVPCGRLALERADIPVDNYYTSEIDKYAGIISHANYPDNILLGDVTRWREMPIDWESIDLLLAGFPCQAFSMAGKGLAFDDPRGKLFFTLIEIKEHIETVNPNLKFLFENVKMKKAFIEPINDLIGVEPMEINSALLSGQSRKRNFWFNWDIEQPKDKGILLKMFLKQVWLIELEHREEGIL